jgi:hypothetical protein
LLVVLLLAELVATIPNSRVMAFVSLDGLKSQGHCCKPHPVVGGVIHPSRRPVFGRWITVLAAHCLVLLSCLRCVAQGWRLTGLEDCCPLGPCEVCVACLLLLERMLLAEPDLFPSLLGIGAKERLCGEGRGKRSWLAPTLVLGPGPCGLAGPRSFGLILARAPWAT